MDARDLEDVVYLIGNSTCPAEQQAALKVVTRVAAMSPADGAVLVDAGLIQVFQACQEILVNLACDIRNTILDGRPSRDIILPGERARDSKRA